MGDLIKIIQLHNKKRAVIAHFDDGSFESFPVIDLSLFVLHASKSDFPPVSFDFFQSCGPAVGQDEILLCNPHLLVSHSTDIYVTEPEKFQEETLPNIVFPVLCSLLH